MWILTCLLAGTVALFLGLWWAERQARRRLQQVVRVLVRQATVRWDER